MHGLVESLSACGADTVYVADDQRLLHYSPLSYGNILNTAVQSHSPDIFLFPATTQGNDLAPAVAQSTDSSCVIDACTVDFTPDGVVGKRLEYDRKVLTGYVRAGSRTQILTALDGIAEVPTPAPGHQATVTPLSVVLDEGDLVARVLKREIAGKTVNLKEARVIVACGAGVGSKENFAVVEEFARVVGGEIGASRAAVDAGWATLDRQIGQTGVTVRPDLYFAVGISGAIQHRVGMLDSKCIVAINSDANAPIFRFSHYCIVGDLNEVIPKLTKLWDG